MSLAGIFSSPSQRRKFLLASTLVIIISLCLIWVIYYFSADTRGWNTLINLMVSIVASAVFALASALYISYFFIDPVEVSGRFIILPQDIGKALRKSAANASDYRVYVRTGRHFRADILPILIENAITERRPTRIEVVLLDFRDYEICEKYAAYRRNASFDRHLWDRAYVQREVMATILRLANVAADHGDFLDITLSLSSRLSTFRIEGSSQEIIVTREDPKDMAVRYTRADRDHAAFITEFNWIRDASSPVNFKQSDTSPRKLADIFGDLPLIAELEHEALLSIGSKSPYAR
ncbi:hypothetical protein [Sinorhizobium sp. Sb3]|uniref:hypothetical protein n=1 Tax=Sinorhizobium sp. Sb3 TaxID=1358417 RepID=UPI000AECCA3F|nr:hypothetical protein [Sinorhizobium sp. Sb3]